MGQMIKAIENELVVTDDRTFRWSLKKPYPKMLLALGKSTSPCCFVMPARIAATDPSRQISEYVGSGPMRFVRKEWVPGAKAVFEKFAERPCRHPGCIHVRASRANHIGGCPKQRACGQLTI